CRAGRPGAPALLADRHWTRRRPPRAYVVRSTVGRLHARSRSSPMTRARWAARIIARLMPPDLREPFVDDVEEAVWQRRETDGAWAARRWYWFQLASSLMPVLQMRLR